MRGSALLRAAKPRKSLTAKANAQSRSLPYQPKISKSPPRTEPQSVAKPKPFRKGPLIIGGIFAYGLAFYGFSMYSNYQRTIKENKLRVVPEDVSDRYNESAEHFDSDVGTIEWMMGLLKMRKKLAKEAEGDVLEVSVGTGRNIEYYSLDKCKSITMVDLSPEMVEIARKKFKEAHPRYSNVTFRTQSAMVPIDAPSPQGFDTIIQTMGLCSTPEPVKLLDNLGRLANQEHGRILLLEHGKSYYTKLNEIMDNLAPAHADKHGCWWNRDIGAIIAESGLEVVSIDRYHFGTTWKVELRPRQTTLKSDTKDKGSK